MLTTLLTAPDMLRDTAVEKKKTRQSHQKSSRCCSTRQKNMFDPRRGTSSWSPSFRPFIQESLPRPLCRASRSIGFPPPPNLRRSSPKNDEQTEGQGKAPRGRGTEDCEDARSQAARRGRSEAHNVAALHLLAIRHEDLDEADDAPANEVANEVANVPRKHPSSRAKLIPAGENALQTRKLFSPPAADSEKFLLPLGSFRQCAAKNCPPPPLRLCWLCMCVRESRSSDFSS